jgi:hypothetical protein
MPVTNRAGRRALQDEGAASRWHRARICLTRFHGGFASNGGHRLQVSSATRGKGMKYKVRMSYQPQHPGECSAQSQANGLQLLLSSGGKTLVPAVH